MTFRRDFNVKIKADKPRINRSLYFTHLGCFLLFSPSHLLLHADGNLDDVILPLLEQPIATFLTTSLTVGASDLRWEAEFRPEA